MKLAVSIFLAILSGGFAQEVFLQGNRPYIVLPRAQRESEGLFDSELVGRSGLVDDTSSEEEVESHQQVKKNE